MKHRMFNGIVGAFLVMALAFSFGCNSTTAPTGATDLVFLANGVAFPDMIFLLNGTAVQTNADGHAAIEGTCWDHTVISPSPLVVGWTFTPQEINPCQPVTRVALTQVGTPDRPHVSW